MASKLFSFITLPLILTLLLFFTSPSSSQTPPSPAINPVCSSTPDPSYCNSVLPNNQTANVFDYARFSFLQSLSQARQFSALVNKYLTQSSSLTTSAIRALQDCQELAGLNIDFLSTSSQTVESYSGKLPTSQVDSVHALLSAILTNQQTCLDGLQASSSSWTLKNGLSAPISNDTKLYSVSLALFTKGWVSETKNLPWQPTGKQLGFRNGRLPLKMSSRTRAIYESVSRRKLLQTSDNESVLVNDMVVVSQDGSGNFTIINDAINAAPNNLSSTDGYFLIYVTAGVYEEYVSIAKNDKYLMIIGDGINQTVITGSRSVAGNWTTFNSATFAVVGQGFVAVNITFRNTAGSINHQAVALRSGADMSTFYSCSFEGYQDTLYPHSLRQFYRECDIYGTVDFIFGNAAVVLQNCNLYPRLPMNGQFNAITAQGRSDMNQNTGTSIHNCTIRAAQDLATSNVNVQTYLGRPWKEYSRTVYMQSFMDSLINPAGWMQWNGDFALSTLYYAEYENRGPGSDTSNRVNWTGYQVNFDANNATTFTVSNFIIQGNNWLDQTGVPYTGGLM